LNKAAIFTYTGQFSHLLVMSSYVGVHFAFVIA